MEGDTQREKEYKGEQYYVENTKIKMYFMSAIRTDAEKTNRNDQGMEQIGRKLTYLSL